MKATEPTAVAIERNPWRQLLDRYLPEGGRTEVVAAGFVVAIVLAMILPMPTWLLDVLIAFSMSVAALVVVMVLQIRQSTDLSAYPSLLLITTLLRISISIASTRLVLLEGEAGHIIQAFGEVVAGGNLVVGLVVFCIITVVQFLVITKGAERVAEVGARFTLDAMPGKQLAIDVEMKAGAITLEQTKGRRAALARESQFFGAMDGAMKFVKGDAIAGILIVLINLLGGMMVGMAQRGLSAGEAARIYSVLSIGDGLVAQIPALLMAVSAGILVTRVEDSGAEEGSRAVGKELVTQLLAYPRAWMTASLAMVLFGLLPGMPLLVFVVLAGGAFAVGAARIYLQLRDEREDHQRTADDVPELRDFEPVRAFTVRLDAALASPNDAQRFVNLARHVRNDMATRYGMVLPPIEVDENQSLDGADIEFCCDEMGVFATPLRAGLHTLECSAERLAQLGVVPVATDVEPLAPGRVRAWVGVDDARRLREAGEALDDFWAWAERRLAECLASRGPRYFGIEQAARLMRWITERYPDMGKELERVLPPARLAEVLQRLLAERVSIRNVYAIAQALVEWAPRERDAAVLNEYVRATLSRDICHAYARDGELQGYLLDAEFENRLRGAVRQTAFGDVLDLDQEATDAALDQLASQLAHGQPPAIPILLCRQDVRPHVRTLFRERFEHIPVLALTEVTQEYRVTLLGVIEA